MNLEYKNKYLKYKRKYTELKKQTGGVQGFLYGTKKLIKVANINDTTCEPYVGIVKPPTKFKASYKYTKSSRTRAALNHFSITCISSINLLV